MAQSATSPMRWCTTESRLRPSRRMPVASRCRVTHDLSEVEAVWQALSAGAGRVSRAGFRFHRLWAEALEDFGQADQFYVVANEDGAPVALLPLQRRWDMGVRVLSWFPGPHVGCNAPLVDTRAACRDDSGAPARSCGATCCAACPGADIVHLRSVPELPVDGVDLFAELGQSIAADTLYRARSRASRTPTRRSATNRAASTIASRATSSRRWALSRFEELDNGPSRGHGPRHDVPPARRALPRNGRVRPVRRPGDPRLLRLQPRAKTPACRSSCTC